MYSLLFPKLLSWAVILATLFSATDANIEACSPSNTDIKIDAQHSGVISTPTFPDGFSGGTCIWRIQAPANFRLALTIEALNFKGIDDHLVIRDGDSPSSPLIGKYGPCAKGSVALFSSGRSAFLQTVSAVFRSTDELRIVYRPIHPDDIDCSSQADNPPNFCSDNTELKEKSGVFSSPNFPNNYDAGQDCLWTIIAPQGYRVKFEIHWFGIEDDPNSRPGGPRCLDDSLEITEYRGNTTKTQSLAVLCGCKETFTNVSFREKMWFIFKSYKKANWPGFYVSYQVLAPDECPAGNTDCPLKTMPPVGFNAQGQVCSASALSATSSTQEVMTSSATPSLVPSSEKSLPKTSARALQKITSGISSSEISLIGTYKRSSARTSSRAQNASTQKAKSTKSLALLPSTPESSVKATIHALETSTLVTSHSLESSYPSGSIFEEKAVKSVKSRSQLSETFWSSLTITPSTKVTTIKQISTHVITPSRVITSTFTMRDRDSIASLDVIGLSQVPVVKTKATYTTNQTQTLNYATNVKSRQITKRISDASIKVKDGEAVGPAAQLRESRSSLQSVTSTMTRYKTESLKPSQNKVTETIDSKYTETRGETKFKLMSKAANFQTQALESHQSSLVVRTTRLIREANSMSRSGDTTFASQGMIIQPSKASKESEEAPRTASVTVTQKTPVNRTLVIEGRPKGMSVKCTHYAIEITISRIQQPKLDITTLHLQDPSCKVTFSNDTHAFIRAPLESCETERRTSKYYFIYSNSLLGNTRFGASALITRDGQLKFEIQCLYRRIHVLSIVSYSARRKLVRTDGGGVGNFTFGMDMFKDPKYNIAVKQYPFNVHPGQLMYFQVDVKSSDRELVAFLEKCWVTPTPNPLDQTRYTLIEHGCPRDSSLQYRYEKSATQKFTFKAFRFRRVPTSRLFVHCEVETCRRSDKGSVCDMGCVEKVRRRRESRPYMMDKDLFLSLGPVKLQKEKTESQTSVIYVQALTGLLGIISMILLIAIVIVITKRRKDRKKTWKLFSSARTQRSQDGSETSSKLMSTEL